jgi:hypothetical protein
MNYYKRNHCQHPKAKISKYTDENTNTYYEKCCRCGKVLYAKKFRVSIN